MANLMKRAQLTVGTLVFLAVGLYLVLRFTGLSAFTVIFHQNPGRFDRESLEGVVTQVRLSGMKPGEQKEFMLDDLSEPKTLHPIPNGRLLPRGHEAGHVWAEVSTEGKLKVVIETRDLGHAGEYGFAYSEIPLTPKPSEIDRGWFSIDVPGRLNLVQPDMKVDDHWWKVVFNLD